MSKYLNIDNIEYISSIAAGKSVGYSHDYLSRLCRSGNLECRRIGRVWYIERDSLNLMVMHGASIRKNEPEVLERSSHKPLHKPKYSNIHKGEQPFAHEVVHNAKYSGNTFTEIQTETETSHKSFIYPITAPIEIEKKSSIAPHKAHLDAPERTGSILSSLVGTMIALVVLVGGYTSAQIFYKNSLAQEFVSETFFTMKLGMGHISSEAAQTEIGKNVFSNVASVSQGIAKLNWTAATNVFDTTARNIYSFVNISGRISNVVGNLSGKVITYGETPVNLLAATLGSLTTEEALLSGADSLYEVPEKSIDAIAVETVGTSVAEIPQIIKQTIINQPVIERIVEKHFTVIESGVTLEQLQQSENELRQLISTFSGQNEVRSIDNFRTIALSQKIDNLGSVDITNSTFASGSISSSSAALTTLTVSGSSTFNDSVTFNGTTTFATTPTFTDLTLSGDLAVNGGDITTTATTWNFDVADTGTIQFRDGTNTLFTIVDNGTTGDVTISGDLTISGDDLTLGTNTSGFLLVADGTNFNPVALSGDITIDGAGLTAIAADALDFTEFKDALTLDASTDIAIDGTEVFSLTNTGTGSSFIVNDAASDTSPFVIDNSGDTGIGVTDPDIKLEVFETVAAAQLKLSYDATRYTQFQTNSVGDLVVDAQGGDVFLNDENLFVCTGGSCPAGTPASTGTIIAESRIGIGTADPVSNLEIANNVQAGMDAYTDYQILLHDTGTATTSIGIGVETGTLAFNTDADYDFYIDGAVTPEVSFNTTTSTF
ncbi:MAG: hypothetical protein JKX80_01800, partial [Candidatus Pacebacteria bacterium]|nr:hypothetical protein [Candidatus Paceibacterota bacterium]